LRRVLDKILESNSLQLDEAKNYVEKPHEADLVFPFRLEKAPAEPTSQTKKRPAKDKKGTFRPVHSRDNEKYNRKNLPKDIKKLIKEKLAKNKIFNRKTKKTYVKLVANSLAKSTWKRYSSAQKIWTNCKKDLNLTCKEFDNDAKIAFICWCNNNTNLKSQTISMYISAINRIEKLTNNESALKNLLKGCKNMDSKNKKKQKKFKSLNFQMLKLIKNKLKKSILRKTDRKSIWTACVLAFWGCFRLGEILGKKKGSFDKYSDLLWKDVNIRAGKVRITLKSSKTSGARPVDVTLTRLPQKGLCPFRAMKSLRHAHRKAGLFDQDLPVFRMEDGEVLTKKTFLEFLDAKRVGISGKSFRSGIPTLLAHLPHPPKMSLIKSAGRWKSAAYQTYIGGGEGEKDQANFKNIATMLLKSPMCRSGPEESQEPDCGGE